jgi:hypothetical protein
MRLILIIATLPLIIGVTWAIIEHRRRQKLADDWANFRSRKRQ